MPLHLFSILHYTTVIIVGNVTIILIVLSQIINWDQTFTKNDVNKKKLFKYQTHTYILLNT